MEKNHSKMEKTNKLNEKAMNFNLSQNEEKLLSNLQSDLEKVHQKSRRFGPRPKAAIRSDFTEMQPGFDIRTADFYKVLLIPKTQNGLIVVEKENLNTNTFVADLPIIYTSHSDVQILKKKIEKSINALDDNTIEIIFCNMNSSLVLNNRYKGVVAFKIVEEAVMYVKAYQEAVVPGVINTSVIYEKDFSNYFSHVRAQTQYKGGNAISPELNLVEALGLERISKLNSIKISKNGQKIDQKTTKNENFDQKTSKSQKIEKNGKNGKNGKIDRKTTKNQKIEKNGNFNKKIENFDLQTEKIEIFRTKKGNFINDDKKYLFEESFEYLDEDFANFDQKTSKKENLGKKIENFDQKIVKNENFEQNFKFKEGVKNREKNEKIDQKIAKNVENNQNIPKKEKNEQKIAKKEKNGEKNGKRSTASKIMVGLNIGFIVAVSVLSMTNFRKGKK